MSRRLEAARFYARVAAGTAIDVAAALAGRGDPFAPPRRLLGEDYSDFDRIGEEFLGHFTELGGLRPDDRVLDIGCGLGRMAVPLTRYLTVAGSYEGFDVVEPEIAWCRRNISARHPNFQFRVLDVRNERYNPGGSAGATGWPFAAATFDFAIAASLFTHLRPDDAAAYLDEAARVLKPGGTLFATFFLLDEETRPRIERGESYYSFRHRDGPAAADQAESFEAAVAYDRTWVEERLAGAGLRVDQVHHGYWSGTDDFLTWQDAIVARRT